MDFNLWVAALVADFLADAAFLCVVFGGLPGADTCNHLSQPFNKSFPESCLTEAA